MKEYLSNFQEILLKNGIDIKIADILNQMYIFIQENEWCGACHACSSFLYVALKEKGLNPTLCIGEVKYNNFVFDHSWIELNNKIIDISICMTLANGIALRDPIVMDLNV
ncbi:MAG: hypothetical protein ACI4XR_02470 [Bacilli bacterium]